MIFMLLKKNLINYSFIANTWQQFLFCMQVLQLLNQLIVGICKCAYVVSSLASYIILVFDICKLLLYSYKISEEKKQNLITLFIHFISLLSRSIDREHTVY